MKITELRPKSVEQLQQQLLELRKDSFSHRLQFSAGHMSDSSFFKKTRRDIARIKTLLTEKTDQGS